MDGPPLPPRHLPPALVEAPVADEPRVGGRHAAEHGRPSTQGLRGLQFTRHNTRGACKSMSLRSSVCASTHLFCFKSLSPTHRDRAYRQSSLNSGENERACVRACVRSSCEWTDGRPRPLPHRRRVQGDVIQPQVVHVSQKRVPLGAADGHVPVVVQRGALDVTPRVENNQKFF